MDGIPNHFIQMKIARGENAMIKEEFSKEQIAEYAVSNAGGLWLTTALYFKSKGMSITEWADYVGSTYAPSWDALQGKGALAALRMAALNWISCGAVLHSIAGDETRAEAELEWPPEWIAKDPPPEVYAVNQVFVPITREIGLSCTWKNEGSRIWLTFSKA
jgi:hypothetical protein